MVGTNPVTTSNGGWRRPRYFDRQPLAAADLNLGVDYVRQRLRSHNRFLHGWGIVAGARVSRISAEDLWAVRVTEGYVVTPLGDEVHVPDLEYDLLPGVQACLGDQRDCADLDAEPTTATVRVVRAQIDPPGPDDRRNYNAEWVDVCLLRDANLNGFTVQHIINPGEPDEAIETYFTFSESGALPRGAIVRIHSGSRLRDEAPDPELVHRYVAPDDQLGNWRLNNEADTIIVRDAAGAVQDSAQFLAGSTVPLDSGAIYLVACPQETPECPQPGVPLDCLPPGSNYQFSRMREGYRLDVVCDLPGAYATDPPDCAELQRIVCEGGTAPLPPPPGEDANCVVLATVQLLEGGILILDDMAYRRVLLPTSIVQQHVGCRCNDVAEPPAPATPTPPPTRTPEPATPPPTPTPPTVFTQPTAPTRFTVATDFTLPTIGTVFTRPTVFTRFSRFTDLTLFTDFTGTLGPDIGIFTGSGPDFGLDRTEFDVDRGRTEPLTSIEGVGASRAERLRELGVTNVLEFAAMSTEVAAELMNVSEVQVAAMQEQARGIMRRR